MAKDQGFIPPSEGPIVGVEKADTGEARTSEQVPDNLSVADTVEWVGNDKARAQAVLDAEGKDGRKTLVEQLNRVLNEDTGAGVASGEA